jgi:hypothetical protein
MKPKIRFYRGVWECTIPSIRHGSFGFGKTPSEAWKMFTQQHGTVCKQQLQH